MHHLILFEVKIVTDKQFYINKRVIDRVEFQGSLFT